MSTREERLAAAIAACEDDLGAVTPESVLAAAQDPKHPSYDVLQEDGNFDWDDKSAAYTARLDHARKLIREVRFVVYEGQQTTFSVKAYVRDGIEKPAKYRPIRDLEKDVEFAKRALLDGLLRIENAVNSMASVSLVAKQKTFTDQFRQMARMVERMRGDVASLTPPPRSQSTSRKSSTKKKKGKAGKASPGHSSMGL